MDPIVLYVGFVVLALLVLAIATLLSPAAKRDCPNCAGPLALTARACRRCGYALP
jgi:predicted amidophosphoribosyltransferase